jgi:hypothetical protein
MSESQRPNPDGGKETSRGYDKNLETEEGNGNGCYLLQWGRGPNMSRTNFGLLLGGYREMKLITSHPSRPVTLAVKVPEGFSIDTASHPAAEFFVRKEIWKI